MAEPLSQAAERDHGIFGTVTQAEFLDFLDRYADADAKVAEAVADRKDLRAAIKAVGIPLTAFDRVRRDSEMSGEVRERDEAWYRQMMAWQKKPVGFQASMDLQADPGTMALNVHELKRVDTEGFDAGKGGLKRDTNSYTPGTEAYQRWDAAWMRGQAEIAESMAPDTPKRRGRPRGSKNRSRLTVVS